MSIKLYMIERAQICGKGSWGVLVMPLIMGKFDKNY